MRDRRLFELRLNKKRLYLISIVDYRSLSSMGIRFEFWPRYQASTALFLSLCFDSRFFLIISLSKRYTTYLLPVPLSPMALTCIAPLSSRFRPSGCRLYDRDLTHIGREPNERGSAG